MNTAWQLHWLHLPKSSGEVSFIKQITCWIEPLKLAPTESFGREPTQCLPTQESLVNCILGNTQILPKWSLALVWTLHSVRMGYSADVINIPAAVWDKREENNLRSVVIVGKKIVPCYSLKDNRRFFLIVCIFFFYFGKENRKRPQWKAPVDNNRFSIGFKTLSPE